MINKTVKQLVLATVLLTAGYKGVRHSWLHMYVCAHDFKQHEEMLKTISKDHTLPAADANRLINSLFVLSARGLVTVSALYYGTKTTVSLVRELSKK